MEDIIEEKGTIKARLKELADTITAKQLDPEVQGINSFSLACGKSIGWAKGFKSNKMLPRQIEAVKSRFPYVNIDWVLTGEGEMFLYMPTRNSQDGEGDFLAAQVAVLFQQVADLLAANKQLQEKIHELEEKIG